MTPTWPSGLCALYNNKSIISPKLFPPVLSGKETECDRQICLCSNSSLVSDD